MNIRISELRTITEKLFLHLEENYGEMLEIDSDFYWDIPEESRLDPYQQPQDLSIGQLGCISNWLTAYRLCSVNIQPGGPITGAKRRMTSIN